jgi:hypothetical protein
MRLRAATVAAALAAIPAVALAHASERMVILTLPTGYYMAGAALAVALTAAVGLAAPRLPRIAARRLATRRQLLSQDASSTLACLVFFGLVAIGAFGSRDPFGNLLPLTLWTLVWVGLTLATVLFGNLWSDIEPWTGPVRAARRLIGLQGGIGLSRLGHWPAVAGFLAFAWFEIVSLRPDDPAVLARVALGYWAVIFVLAVLEGERWLHRGEAFTVFYGLIARIAPFWAEADGPARLRIMASAPGARLRDMAPLAPDAIAFVTLVLASVTFDGLSETFRWLALIGINPLEFPGRSAVTGVNTVGLVTVWALTAGAILGAVALGRGLAGRAGPFLAEAGPFLLAFLPIAAGYHVAHYLVALLTNGQYAIEALNDPFGRGWSLLGLPHHWASFGFLADRAAVTAIWNLQFAAILGAHVLAVLVALEGARGDLRLHLPMTVLMVAYTVLGLWLLSAATAG